MRTTHRPGAPVRVEREVIGGALWGGFAALPLVWFLRGFTVDDALIPARYAHHLARGLGYRFNPGGPMTDGVTPLGFAHLLAPFAGKGVLAAWSASRWLGRAFWLAAAMALGARVGADHLVAVSADTNTAASEDPSAEALSSRGAVRFAAPSLSGRRLSAAPLALLLVACSAPLGAWCSSGLETSWVVGLATAAAVLPPRPAQARLGSLLAGACAWLRPEMIVFALALALGRARTANARKSVEVTCVALGAAPWMLVAITRFVLWGHPAPLAVLAKPSDLTHGVMYALPAVLFTGAPLAALAPRGGRYLSPWARTLLLGGFAQLAALALAGGDWMPLARLVCPLLPAFVVVSAELLSHPRARAWALARLALGCIAELTVLGMRGEAARRVADDRLALITAAQKLLVRTTRVATVDVGWVGAAMDGEVVDLAGATDAHVAALPGGHTSKAISAIYLTARAPDLLLFQLAAPPGVSERAGDASPPARGASSFARVVEQRLAHDPLIAATYHPTWMSPSNLPIAYVALERARD